MTKKKKIFLYTYICTLKNNVYIKISQTATIMLKNTVSKHK